MKKILGIIIILVIVVVGGFLAVKFFGGKSTGSIGGKSIMDLVEEQSAEKMSENDWIKGCEESDFEIRDGCFSMGAVYYRNPRFCDHISKLADRTECKKEIEQAYKELGDIEKLPPEEQMLKMQEWVYKQSMMKAIFEESYDEGAEEAGPGEEVEAGETKPEEPIIKSTGKMNDDIYVEIMARTMYFGQLIQADPMAAQGIANKVKDSYREFGVTEEEFEAYADKLGKEAKTNPTKVMQLMQKANQRVVELQKTGF